MRVLFVCLGNICRSTMAEAVMRHLVETSGLSDRIEVDSAGIGSWYIGQPPHRGTRQKLAEAGVSDKGIRARQITRSDFSDFDCIVGMDDENLRDLNRLSGGAGRNCHLLSDFVENPTWNEVPDPYYTGDFDTTYALVTEGCAALLEHLKRRL